MAEAAADIVSSVKPADVERARAMLRGIAVRTPLVPLVGTRDRTVLFKPESIQPHGSFKVRCGTYAVLSVPEERLDNGLYTASAGNFGQGVVAAAARRGVKVKVYAPASAARTKIESMRRLGAEVEEVPFTRWWEILSGAVPEGERAHMVHPCSGREAIIGNATIGAEIIEDAPDADAILVPFGGGGLTLGIATAVRLFAPHMRVVACEASSSTPFTSALKAGMPVEVHSRETFIDGIGGAMVLPSSWPMLSRHVSRSAVIDDEEAAGYVALMFRSHRIVVEGAGAVPVAIGATSDAFRGQKVVAIVSGGNLDERVLADILSRHR